MRAPFWNLLIGLSILCVLLPGRPESAPGPAAGEPGGGAEGRMPASLDSLYPPIAPAPVYLIQKIRMADALSAIQSDMMQGDGENLQTDFDYFARQYAEVASLVPEWRERFPEGPVGELGAAVAAGDPSRVQTAFEALGGVCSSCHETDLARVQVKYGWRPFDAISVQDPVSGTEMPLKPFMLNLAANLAGISKDMEQGQRDRALANCRDLAVRYDALAEACTGCHDTERHYYVDAEIRGVIDRLAGVLAPGNPDPAAVGRLTEAIGMGSCYGCHLVHMPAALAQGRARRGAPMSR